MVVRAAPDSPQDLVIDYIVLGLRIGYEDHPVLQRRTTDSRVPFTSHYETIYGEHPGVRASSPLHRHGTMRQAAGILEPSGTTASAALREAIGEHAPEAATPPRLAPPTLEGSGGDRRHEIGGEAAVPTDAEPDRARPAGRAPPDRPWPSADAGTDLAVVQHVSDPVEAGDVVVLDRDRHGTLRRGREQGDPGVVGVVSAEPWVALGGRLSERDAAVSLAGITTCKVDADYGAIRIGDLLTVSATEGHAIRADRPVPGTVLGKALEPLASGKGRIRILVMLR
jgi:hypothetical protein